MEADRNLGKLKDVNDPYWLSQLTVPKQPEFWSRWVDATLNVLHRGLVNAHVNLSLTPASDTRGSQLGKVKCDLFVTMIGDVLIERYTLKRPKDTRQRCSCCPHPAEIPMEKLSQPLWKWRWLDRSRWLWDGYGVDGFLISDEDMSSSQLSYCETAPCNRFLKFGLLPPNALVPTHPRTPGPRLRKLLEGHWLWVFFTWLRASLPLWR
ncbi:hypothetical protein AJ80_06273 [Polytolypa hystricis UAMH7299]|uniref:Uncharacterized protein n=1 Tax=Polytolypa hystricis (strain UAMH7299) TaxID=1447883 RepID=A0A2B7XXL2_POLH7|nr:hypothetical protein AJ80_06273 [Polytolypa hystricis UAMH7299]